jgi:hypothetical protein
MFWLIRKKLSGSQDTGFLLADGAILPSATRSDAERVLIRLEAVLDDASTQS